DQMEGGNLQAEQVTPLLASANTGWKQTASWIVGHHPDWGNTVAGFFSKRLATAGSLTVPEREELQNQLAKLSQSPAIQDLLAATLHDTAGGTDCRLIALRAMAQAGLKETPSAWLTEVARLLGATESNVVRQAVSTSRALPIPKGGGDHADLTAALLR